jgi:uncharacterized protein YndB with AHSA1/START domain
MTAPVIHDTFVLERRYPAPVAKVFEALSNPAKKSRWFASVEGREGSAYELDFRIGGVERSSSRMGPETPFPGVELATNGRVEDIVPDARVVLSSTMTLGGRRISTALVSFEIDAADGGTRLTFTHQACFYEGADGPQMRKGGWESLLSALGDAVAA